MKISVLVALVAILFSGCHGGQLSTEFGGGDEFKGGNSEPMIVERVVEKVVTVKEFICEEVPPPPVEEYQCPDCLRYFPQDADTAGIVLPKRLFESKLLQSPTLQEDDGEDDGDMDLVKALDVVEEVLSVLTPFTNPKTDISSICYANKYFVPALGAGAYVASPADDMGPESLIVKSENFGVIFKGVMPEGFSMSSFLERKMKEDDPNFVLPDPTQPTCTCPIPEDREIKIGDKCPTDTSCIVTESQEGVLTGIRLLADQNGAFFIGVVDNKVLLMGQLGSDAIFLGTRAYWDSAKISSSTLENKCPQKEMMRELPADASFRHAKVFTEQSMDPIAASIFEKVAPILKGDLMGSRAAVAADLYDKILLMAKFYTGDEQPAIDAFFRLSLKDFAPINAAIIGVENAYQVFGDGAALDAANSVLSGESAPMEIK